MLSFQKFQTVTDVQGKILYGMVKSNRDFNMVKSSRFMERVLSVSALYDGCPSQVKSRDEISGVKSIKHVIEIYRRLQVKCILKKVRQFQVFKYWA